MEIKNKMIAHVVNCNSSVYYVFMPEERGGIITRSRADDWGSGGSLLFGGGLTAEQLSKVQNRGVHTIQRPDGEIIRLQTSDHESTPLCFASTAKFVVNGFAPPDTSATQKEFTSHQQMQSAKVRHACAAPPEKYTKPVTSAQDYGWHAKNPPSMPSTSGDGSITVLGNPNKIYHGLKKPLSG